MHLELLKFNADRKLIFKLARKLSNSRLADDPNVLSGLKECLAGFKGGLLEPLQKYFAVQPLGSALEVNAPVVTFFYLVSCIYLQQQAKNEQVLAFVVGLFEVLKIEALLDPFLAKLYFTLTQAALSLKKDVQPFLLKHFTTCSLKRLHQCCQVLHNQIVRIYLDRRAFDQAAKFIELKAFPLEDSLGMSDAGQAARHYYYLAQIKAVQMDYAAAETLLEDAVRKVHVSAKSAGFLQAAYKLLVTVQLLLGKVPERKVFSGPFVSKSLRLYLAVAKSVRFGNIEAFMQTLREYSGGFEADGTLMFISRLHQNVVRAGLKRICAAYTRISLVELSRRLCLESVDDVKYIVLKAIKDGVISDVSLCGADLVRKEGVRYMYRSSLPHHQLHERIDGCCRLLAQVQKSMTFRDVGRVMGEEDKGGIGRNKPTEEGEIEDFFDEVDFY